MSKIYFILIFNVLILFSVRGNLNAQSDASAQRITHSPSLNLYPQPAADQLYIEFSGTLASQPQIDMYDMIGNLQDKITPERINPSTFMLNLSGKRAGFYFLRIRNEEGSWSRRITVRP